MKTLHKLVLIIITVTTYLLVPRSYLEIYNIEMIIFDLYDFILLGTFY